MQILDRYVNAVGKYLPERQRDDILKELAANLQAEIDDREAELDRALSEDEIAQILKRHGHPMAVAGRYAPPRYLIGPTLFPVYWFVIVRAIPIATLVYGIVSAVLLATGPHSGQEIRAALLRYPGVLFNVAGWVTLVFAVFDLGMRGHHWSLKEIQNWDPRKLPDPKPAAPNRLGLILEATMGALFTAWIALIPRYPYLLLGPAAAYLSKSAIQLAPIWQAMYWPVVLFFAARSLLEFVTAFWPQSREHRPFSEVVLHMISVVGFIIFLRAGEYFVLAEGADAARYAAPASALNQAVRIAMAVGLVVALAGASKAAWRVVLDVRSRRIVPPGNAVV